MSWPRDIGLVGCGAMGTAMVRGIRRGAPDVPVVVADAVPAAADAAAVSLDGRLGSVAAAGACELVILAVKPKDAADAAAALVPSLTPDSVVLSVVAGWDLERLATALGERSLVRTMPNLAVRDGLGLVAVAHRGVAADRLVEIMRVLQPLGTVEELPEGQFATATALAGSGPGFVALVAEGLEEGAVAAGFDRPQARRMVQAVIAGTAALLADGTAPSDLRRQVSSPGGTTVAGVAVLEQGAVRAHLADAVGAASRRATEL